MEKFVLEVRKHDSKEYPEKTTPSSDNDFIPMKKKLKITPNDLKCMFGQSTIAYTTVHSTFSSNEHVLNLFIIVL